MDPDRFGPGAWMVLHHATFSYPDNPSPSHKRAMSLLVGLLGRLLPCSICASHFRELLRQHPIRPALRSRGALIRWMCMMHSKVNGQIEGKRKTKPPTPAVLLQKSAQGYKKGLMDLIYCMAIVTPKQNFMMLKKWLTAAAEVFGTKRVPIRLIYKTRGMLLNGINAFYKKRKSRVLNRYRPWMTKNPKQKSWAQNLLASAFGKGANR